MLLKGFHVSRQIWLTTQNSAGRSIMKRICSVAILMMTSMLFAVKAFATPQCTSCHKKSNPALYLQWENSAHGKNDIGCQDCHEADPSDVDAFKHNGATIATLVTPKDCGKCHAKIEEETSNSYHAHAGEILDSNDAYLAHAAGG